MLVNQWKFEGEIVRTKRFDDGNGSLVVRGGGETGIVELSSFVPRLVYNRITAVDNCKYKKIVVEGHFEIRVHETSGGNYKNTLKLICNDFNWVA